MALIMRVVAAVLCNGLWLLAQLAADLMQAALVHGN